MEEEMDQDDSALALNFSTQLSKKDPGLFLLVPLYKLLRGPCAQAVFKIVVNKFQHCNFFKVDQDRDTQEDKDLYDFLKTINSKGTNKSKKLNKQKNQIKQDNQEKKSWQIFNLEDNEKVLRNVSVRNMKAANEDQCQPLRILDLQILVNILTNAILQYPLSENTNKSINQIKEIRNGLMHAKYDFNKEDFNIYLKRLQEVLQEIYRELGTPEQELSKQIEECEKEATCQDPTSYIQIFKDLQKEIHEKYKLPYDFVSPTIKEASDGEDPYVESLEIYIQDQNSNRDKKTKPILLCGKIGSGKSSILQNQAFQLVKKLKNAQNQDNKISLVILCEENPQGSLKKENFWENVTNSIKSLAPNSVQRFGIDVLQAVIKSHIKETVFLINWNLQEITHRYSETSEGTWVFTYQGYPGKIADWNVLLTEPLKDTQVYQLLQYLNPEPKDREIINEKYRVCNYKSILVSPDMVKIFNELNNQGGLGTEFELMIEYVKKKGGEGSLSNDVMKAVGNLAFHGIRKNKHQFSIDEFLEKGIDESGRLAFFTQNGKYFELIHSSLMDFLASVYVIQDVNNACKDWLNNTIIFKRVFKFTCSFWFRDVDHCWKDIVRIKENKKDYLIKTKEFLCKFLSIEKNRREIKKDHKKQNKPTSSSTMEVDINNLDNITCEGMDLDVSEVEETEMLMTGNPVKNPFNNWGFLVHIDEACNGIPEVLKMLADLLSQIKCWIFKCKEWKDSIGKRIQYILNKVKLSQSSPVIIKIESGPSCSMLINIWNMLKNTESLHNAVKVKISIMHEKNEGKYQILDDGGLKKVPQVIVNARAPVYITELNMPIICPRIPDFKFSMCECIQKLEYLEAIVYDVNSLREVLVCGSLSNLKSIKIYVDLKPSEQRIDSHPQLKIPNPRNKNVNLTIVYFKDIQKLIDAFTCRHRLLSLSISGLVVNGDFKLNMSAFKNMESLYLHCDKNYSSVHEAFNCPLLLSTSLTLPKSLERLLLSGVQFYDDTNIHLFRKFFADYNIQRLMILDSNLSLDGARTVLKQHMFEEKESELHLEMNKKMKIDKSDSLHLKELVAKQPRLSKKDRLVIQKNKPKGKEIIITSKKELKNSICNSKPCHCEIQCTTMLNPSEILKKILEDLSGLIEDTYCYSILSFAFSNENVIVRKDLCNDLRVHCPLFELQDNELYQMQQKQIPSNSPIPRLFQSLTLTQSLYIEKTALSYDGIIALVKIMKDYKSKFCKDNLVEPFSLTVTSHYHPCGSVHGTNSEVLNSKIIEFLKEESCLQMLNFWCTCDNRCHKLKKTHDGDIYVNDFRVYKAPSSNNQRN